METMIAQIGNPAFQNALNRIPQKTPPIWCMRQAGRYHSHYQKLRAKYSFEELCKIPEVASEVALGPIQDFDFDVAILFSDLLFPLDALGLGLHYTDSGPKFDKLLDERNILELNSVSDAIHEMEFQREALKITRKKLQNNKSLIGFVGGLWTLYSYGKTGSHSSLTSAKTSISLRKSFFPIIEDFIIKNIQLQLEGGAEIVMIFDTAAGELSLPDFQEIVLPYIINISEKFPGKVGYYAKLPTEKMMNLVKKIPGLAGIGFDHRLEISDFLRENNYGFVQGNFDQSLLFLSGEELVKKLNNYFSPILELSLEERAGWVSGLGHGILPGTPEANVKFFVDFTRQTFS
jgi:uroporphyrinogen decarboxylase